MRSIADGAHPLMLLGMLAGSVRRLVVERERARKVVGDRRLASAREWEERVFPHVPDDEAKGKKPYGFWMKYQASQRYDRGALLRALCALAEADLRMKSGMDERPLLERVGERLNRRSPTPVLVVHERPQDEPLRSRRRWWRRRPRTQVRTA